MTGYRSRSNDSFDLPHAFELRQVDDYKRIDPVSLDEAQDALITAERFVKAVRQYLTEDGYLPKDLGRLE